MRLEASDILYEDNHLLILRKKPGLLSQADISGDPDILNLAKDYIKQRDHKPGAVYLGLVHRLDRNTGGVFCLAKTSKAASRLSAQIREKSWEKRYLALSTAEPGALKINAAARTEAPLSAGGSCGFAAAADKPAVRPLFSPWEIWQDDLAKDTEKNISYKKKGGRTAVSAHRLLAEAGREAAGEDLCLHEFILFSGRSHQIRVQSAARGFPLWGDLKYGGARAVGESKDFLGLWAWVLKLEHPVRHEPMTFVCPPDGTKLWSLFAAVIRQAGEEAKAETGNTRKLLEKADKA